MLTEIYYQMLCFVHCDQMSCDQMLGDQMSWTPHVHNYIYMHVHLHACTHIRTHTYWKQTAIIGNNKNLIIISETFNKMAIQGKGPDGKWTRKPLAYRKSNIFHLSVTRPPEIYVNLVFKHIHAASNSAIYRYFCSIRLLSSVKTSTL